MDMPTASIAAIAQEAGVSTKTLYRLFPTKADLFSDLVSDRIGRFLLALDLDHACDGRSAPGAGADADGLWHADAFEDTITIMRLVIGESDRFPEIATSFYENAIVRTNTLMEDWLRRQVEQRRSSPSRTRMPPAACCAA